MNSTVQASFYASPTGSGNTCSESSPCSLTGARAKVRSVNGDMSGDVLVYLRGGTYELSSPFELTGQDSGSNGHNVIYEAYEGETPVISGGTEVSGWSIYDSSKNIYRAKVDASLQTRQLYVNGVRATRARGEDNPSGFTPTKTGYETTNTDMQNWGNKSDIEFVGLEQWRNFRCGVESISGATITMKQPCWDNARPAANYMPRLNEPAWIENAYELLDEPGEWYLDRSAGYLYYKPRPGEDMSTAAVVAPKLESLVEGTGTLDDPVHNIRFRGITFSYATWTRPGTNEGYAPEQAGFSYTGDSGNVSKPPASVAFKAAKSIVLERNLFTHLGSNALNFDYGSQDNEVVGNKFEDISGGGIYLGDTDDHHPSDSRAVIKNNAVKNNYITKIGAEYLDTVAILATYTDGSIIEHNEIHDVPYSGISIGWGWGMPDPGGSRGYTTPTTAQNNEVENNLVQDYLQVLRDGGGVYTLGSQPGSVVSGNYMNTQKRDQAALYPDEGTQNIAFNNNVALRVPQWLFIGPFSTIANNTVQCNYSSTPRKNSEGSNNAVGGNTVVTDGNWPQGALYVMSNAGLEAEYQAIKEDGPPASSTPSNTAPKVTITSPLSLSTDRTPTIRAIVRDKETNLAASDISLFVDGGQETNFAYAGDTSELTFTPGNNLSFGEHEVKVVARDAQGLETTATWNFWVIHDPTASNITASSLSTEIGDYAPGAKEVTASATLSADAFTIVDQLVVAVRLKGTDGNYDFYPMFEHPIDENPSTATFKKVFTKPGTYEYFVSYYADGDWHEVGSHKEFTVG